MKYREALRLSLGLLTQADRRRYRAALAAQIALSFLDLAGIVLIGGVGLIAGSVATGEPLPSAMTELAARVGLEEVKPASLAMAAAGLAAVLLVAKSVLSLLVQRRVLLFLARRTSTVARRLAESFLAQPLVVVQSRPSQWTSYAFVEGLTSAVTTLLGQYLVVFSEVSMLVVVVGALLVLDPLTTIVALCYFGLVVWCFNRILGRWASANAGVAASASIAARAAVQDSVATYRELTVAGRRAVYVNRIAVERDTLAHSMANTSLIGAIPRYGMEAALVVGSALLVVSLTASSSPEEAVGGLFLFLAAASRVTPSLLRLNSGSIGVRTSFRTAERTFELAEQLGFDPEEKTPSAPEPSPDSDLPRKGLAIEAEQVTFHYPDREAPSLRSVNLSLAAGSSLAIVGESGAGKSTLADVLLGVAFPSQGEVRIGGVPPAELIAANPGVIAYVPQDVALVHGTVRENVTLGIEAAAVDDAQVWGALERAHLAAFIREQAEGLDTPVGENGVRLSGGQRQRLGLARALYTSPQLLVLDEATSALDSETEADIAGTLAALGPDVTRVTIAHRLATVRDADIVAYMDGGEVTFIGTFDEVRAAIPRFDRQAQLLGL